MKTSNRLTFIWIATIVLIIVGVILLGLMFIPGMGSKTTTATPGDFERGASVTATHFIMPATWTAAPVEIGQPHATANVLPSKTPHVLTMPTTAYKLIPSQTQGPTITPIPTTTLIPTIAPKNTTTSMSPKPTATKGK